MDRRNMLICDTVWCGYCG